MRYHRYYYKFLSHLKKTFYNFFILINFSYISIEIKNIIKFWQKDFFDYNIYDLSIKTKMAIKDFWELDPNDVENWLKSSNKLDKLEAFLRWGNVDDFEFEEFDEKKQKKNREKAYC